MKKFTQALRMIGAVVAGVSSGVALARNIRGLIREIAEDDGVSTGVVVDAAIKRKEGV